MRMHTLDIRVRYAETDRMGLVYYANYFAYFEAGRIEYLRAIGTVYRDLEDAGVLFPVREASCDYVAPARYDDELRVMTWVPRLRPTRIDFGNLVVRKDDAAPVARGRVLLACLDPDGRPIRIPDAVADAVEVWEGPPEAK